MDESPDQILGIEDVAVMTAKPVNTLRYWRAQKIGPKSAKFGRRVVYRRSDVQAWIDAQFESAS